MKLGKDFWFWVRLLLEILKAILGFKPTNPNTDLSAGHRMFNAALTVLVNENEDDPHASAEVMALLRK